MQISFHGSTSLLSQSSVGLKDIEHPSSLLPIRVQARCISSERHVKTSPSTSPDSSPAPAARESPDLGRWGGGAYDDLDAMNTRGASPTRRLLVRVR